ncbi:transcription termination/antitermination protein NusG [Maioricimonas sp. JC845]|uniref:transcription termination/antitermination protein NusG n=1 Tax=Maioricimonas sp. JC845 TaxID=3232138 RepID=UPI0034573DB9
MGVVMDERDVAAESTPDGLQWYVLKVQSNRERSIRESLLRRIKREGLDEYFRDIVIPTEKIVETKGGKRRVREQKLYPGYMMIHMELNDETWYLVRDTSGVGDFTGAAGKPIPMDEHEINRMLGKEEETEGTRTAQPVVKFGVEIGDTVKVKDGPFESFEGVVDSLDETSGRLKIMVEIFGRSTEVELEHWQVEKV